MLTEFGTPKITTTQHLSGAEALRQKAAALSLPFEQEIQSIIQHMIESLKVKGGGAGLAAPQVGINKRIVICSFTRRIEDLEAMINPEYKPIGYRVEYDWEGCFSIPLVFGKVPRWQAIAVSYYTPQGDEIEKVLQGLAARIYQHECDHLEGKLVIDRAIQLKNFSDEEAYKDFLKVIREKQGTPVDE